MPDAPLIGMRILDFTTGRAGPYCTKLLADYGAEVLKVEPPSGDPSRRFGPFWNDEPDDEGSAAFLHLNTNKQGITLDLETTEAVKIVRRLIPGYDVLVEDFEPGYLAYCGLDHAALEVIRPGIVLASITPWGQDGPYVDYQQSDLVAQAMGGAMLWTGSIEREPLKLAGALSHYHAGATAATAIMMAFYRQELTGEGDHIDVSIYEAQAASRDRSAPYTTNHAYNGMEPKRRGAGTTVAAGVRPCLDGYVNIAGSGPRLPNFLRMIGRDDLVEDERVGDARGVMPADLAEEIENSYLQFLMSRTKREIVAEAQKAHLLVAPINTPADLLEDPHFRERGVWETIEHPRTGPVEYPGRPFLLSATPRPPSRRAPLLGEHNGEVLRALGYSPADLGRLRSLGVI